MKTKFIPILVAVSLIIVSGFFVYAHVYVITQLDREHHSGLLPNHPFFLIPQAFADCVLDTDWAQKPCLDTPPYTIQEKKEAWAPYYDYKGAEWMEMKKMEMDQILDSEKLEDWKEKSHANYNVWYYNTLFGEYPVPFYEEKSLEENLKENRLPIGQGVYMDFTFFLILLGGGIGGIIFAIKRKRK